MLCIGFMITKPSELAKGLGFAGRIHDLDIHTSKYVEYNAPQIHELHSTAYYLFYRGDVKVDLVNSYFGS